MRNGEHSTGDTAGTAQAVAPAHASTEAGGGSAATGWLDRIASRSRPDAPSTHALRPRLPYPFEAMRFATADAAPRMPHPDALRAQPDESAATSSRAGRTDDVAGIPANDALRPASTAHAASAPLSPAAVAPPARERQEAHPVAASQPAGRVQPEPAKEERAPLHRETQAPSAPPSVAAQQVAPSKPARLAPPAAASRQFAAPTHDATPAASTPARQDDHGAAHATPRRAWPAPAGMPAPQPIERSAAATRPAGAERSQPALRGAPPQQTPLAARPFSEAAQEITIDIHIGRIDVRAPAGASAPTAVQAAPQRGGDALNAYLSRRARGARS
ncbi:hypothetical protein HUX88_30140 [Duganella sp. BJB1802]|uniref:hypothetical protein n=1 Tax=Duganella sp. BJB1802 TaxID=2744575 RepID=UPI001593DFF4|nr:hypothetical protein [Duganella sp. BJB1802]NVD74751.1 hypothetical protein [Duganella sp. BJB1802]